jgi:catechol 2,3-dioxygenase-like lactoylglutathione lyase family enzyme
MDSDETFPRFGSVALDSTDARRLAEFYRQLLGFSYRAGDEPPADGRNIDERGRDWLVLTGPGGAPRIAFQQVDELRESTWPDSAVPQQLHLDLTVPSMEQLEIQHRWAIDLGARLLQDRSHDQEEPLRVYADPDGHPFCIFFTPS